MKTQPIIVSRQDWKAKPPSRGMEPLQDKPSVIVVTNTSTDPCTTREDCIRAVQQIQEAHMDDEGMPDIQYNFLVGGDGRIYEGRGWHTQTGSDYPDQPEGRTIDIAVIENFSSDIDENQYVKMIGTIPLLFLHAVHKGLMEQKYRLVYRLYSDQNNSSGIVYKCVLLFGVVVLLFIVYRLFYKKKMFEERF